MKKDSSFHDYVVQDLLGDIPGITSRAMFGGWGIYKDGVIFALVDDGQLYFKVDDQIRPDFENLGSSPFVYSKENESQVSLSYWLLPEEIMEDEEKLAEWVARSVEVSKQGKKKKKGSK